MAKVRECGDYFGFVSRQLIIGYTHDTWEITEAVEIAFNPLALIAIKGFRPNPKWSEILLPGCADWLLINGALNEITEFITSLLPDERRWG